MTDGQDAVNAAGAPVVAQLVISLHANKAISVTGPINDRMVAYAMLETARDIVYDTAKNAEKLIQPASLAEVKIITDPAKVG
jgi:hypothetical protein